LFSKGFGVVVGEVVGAEVVGDTVGEVGAEVGLTVGEVGADVGLAVGQWVPKLVPVVVYVDPLLRGTTVPHSPALSLIRLHRRTQQPSVREGVDTIAAPGLGTMRAQPSLCPEDDRRCKARSPTARRSAVCTLPASSGP
jgi:hypothetical protein